MAQLPKLTLIWMYNGSDPEARRTVIDSMDYTDFHVIPTNGSETLSQLVSRVPEGSEVSVFWADDGKPIGTNFLREMVHPLNMGKADTQRSVTDMHLWSGNALAMPSSILSAVTEENFVFKMGAFMKMALLFLDTSFGLHGRRAHVAFSSTERVAPMCGEPVGMVS